MHKSGMIELEVVIAVARHGSFRAAAGELGMSPTAVGHAVAGLEARLGVRLFNRTTRSVSLSAAGSDFVAKVAPALSDIQAAIGDGEQPPRHAAGDAADQQLRTFISDQKADIPPGR